MNQKQKIKRIILEEINRFVENDGKIEAVDSHLENLDDVKRAVSELRLDVSRRSWEGTFTHGDLTKIEKKLKNVESILDELEEIFVSERDRR